MGALTLTLILAVGVSGRARVPVLSLSHVVVDWAAGWVGACVFPGVCRAAAVEASVPAVDSRSARIKLVGYGAFHGFLETGARE